MGSSRPKPNHPGRFVGQCTHRQERYDTGKRRPWTKPDGDTVWCRVIGKRDVIDWVWDGTDWVTDEAFRNAAVRVGREVNPSGDDVLVRKREHGSVGPTSLGNQAEYGGPRVTRAFRDAVRDGASRTKRKPAKARNWPVPSGPAGDLVEVDPETGERTVIRSYSRSGRGRGSGGSGSRRPRMTISADELDALLEGGGE